MSLRFSFPPALFHLKILRIQPERLPIFLRLYRWKEVIQMNLNVELFIENRPEGAFAFLGPVCKALGLHRREVPQELVHTVHEDGQRIEYVDRFGYDKLCKMSESLMAAEIWLIGMEAFDLAEKDREGRELPYDVEQYVLQFMADEESISTDELAEDYGVRTRMLNEYLEVKGFQHWVHDRWVCSILPEICSFGNQGQDVIWSAAGRLMLFIEMAKDGLLPMVDSED